MPQSLRISHPTAKLKARVTLPASKSESNRALIINALSGGKAKIRNLSTVDDTVLLQRLLSSRKKELYVNNAGTVMRFLTAFFCYKNDPRILTGSERMKQRPVALLVDALKEIGYDIRYMEQKGYPPVEILPIHKTPLKNKVSIPGNISSQYLSALCMIAPLLPGGLKITIVDHVASLPYLEMTLKMMAYFGIEYDWNGDAIVVGHQAYKPRSFAVEGDWSAASYWYSMAALAKEAEIELMGLKADSFQGDSVIASWMEQFGVETEFRRSSVFIRRVSKISPGFATLNFNDNPDLAPALIVLYAAKDVTAMVMGIESLKIKESDRVKALQNELLKMNCVLNEEQPGRYKLYGDLRFSSKFFQSYNDHRMAMAIAPLALLQPIVIKNASVVSKSYPSFWNDMQKAGFVIEEV